MAVGAVVARILTQYSDKGSKAAQKDIAKLGKNIDGFAKKSSRAFGIAAAASAALALKIGKDAVQAAIADQKSQVLLANSLRNTVGATDAAIAGTENYITAMQKQFNVVDDELRPAMAALTAATGSVTAAQSLMQTALDVSANATVDLGTAVNAIIAGTRGQFKALGKLVPGLDSATIATKDYGKILDKVGKITAGQAAKRAQTLEYRLIGLKIAYGEIVETLGYALLPVIEKFATTISTKVLPQIETWVSLNKDKLAASFQIAADFAVKLLTVAISFGDWISNNMTAVKVMAALIAGMFAVGRASAFIIMLGQVTAAMATLRATATGAAVASAFATGGFSAAAGAAAVAGILAAVGVGLMAPGTTAGGSGKATAGTGNPLPKITSSGAQTGKTSGFFNNSATAFDKQFGVAASSIGGTDALSAFLAALNKNTVATNKNTKSVMDIATENAMKELAARQKALSGSSSISIGGGGKMYGTRNAQGAIQVNVNAGAVVGSTDALIEVVKNGLETVTRRNGRGGSGRYGAMVTL
jgi:hypothetical protein